MDTAQLGPTGITVSRFIFGAGTIGGIGSWPPARGRGISVDAGLDRLDEARRLGIRVVDTADRYAGGDSEKAVGTWLRSRQPEDVLVATKVGMMVDGERRWTDLSAAHVERQLATSIDRLGRVDLYLSHAPDPGTPVEETLTAFAAARADGRIRAFGVCNVTVRELEELLAAADRAGLPRPGWVQNRLNLLARDDQAGLLPLVAAEGLGYTPFSPLAGGVLSDRYVDGAAVPPDSHIGVAGAMFYPGMHTPENLARVAKLRELGRPRGLSVAGLPWPGSWPSRRSPRRSSRPAPPRSGPRSRRHWARTSSPRRPSRSPRCFRAVSARTGRRPCGCCCGRNARIPSGARWRAGGRQLVVEGEAETAAPVRAGASQRRRPGVPGS